METYTVKLDAADKALIHNALVCLKCELDVLLEPKNKIDRLILKMESIKEDAREQQRQEP